MTQRTKTILRIDSSALSTWQIREEGRDPQCVLDADDLGIHDGLSLRRNTARSEVRRRIQVDLLGLSVRRHSPSCPFKACHQTMLHLILPKTRGRGLRQLQPITIADHIYCSDRGERATFKILQVRAFYIELYFLYWKGNLAFQWFNPLLRGIENEEDSAVWVWDNRPSKKKVSFGMAWEETNALNKSVHYNLCLKNQYCILRFTVC